MNELYVVLLNTLFYLILSIYCISKYKWINVATTISLVYFVSAFFSLLLYITPLYYITVSAQGECTFESCIYLFTVNCLLILSFAHVDLGKCNVLGNYNEGLINKIQKFLCVILFICIIFQIPTSIQKFFSGRELSDMREELYGTNDTNGFFLIGIFGRLFGATPFILLIISCINIFLIKKMSSWDKYSIFIYFLYKANTIFSVISRATIIFSFFELMLIYIIFHKHISREIKKRVIKYGLVIIPFFLLVFLAISTSRFGDDDEKENLASLRYAGEANLNFMALEYPDLKEPFWGYSAFPLYRRLIGLPYNDGTSRDGSTVYDTYISRVYKYTNPVYIFHGIAGDIFFNVGFYGCLILSFIFFLIMRRNTRNTTTTTPVKIIVFSYLGSLVLKGVCYLPFGSESDNLLVLYILIFSRIMKKYGNHYIVKKVT